MENSHLVATLRTFSKKEFRELRKWLHSPAHNTRDDVVDLFEYLIAGAHLEKEKFLSKERVFSKIFPAEEYDDAKLRQSIHFLSKAVEEFLINQELQEDEVRSLMALASVYRKKKLDKAFTKTMKGVDSLQEKQPHRNEQYFRNEYLIQQEKYTFIEGKKRTVEMNLQEVSDALDLTYIVDKLRQSCLMLSHQAVYKTNYQIGFLQEVLKLISNDVGLLSVPAVAVYYYIYNAISKIEDPTYFELLRKEMEVNGHLFPHSEMRDIYLMAINYCIGRANTGGETYIREAYELYKLGFSKKVLIENGLVSRYTFRNAVTAALKLKEYDWVDSFIHEYNKYIDKKYRESFFLHSLARLNFEKKDYDSAMRLLVQTDFDDILINLNAKTMLFKMYFELEELDALESLLESMRIYIQRKEIMGYHKSNYQNIIKYTKRLVRINPYNDKQKDKLRKEIEEANPLTEREWLLEQLQVAV